MLLQPIRTENQIEDCLLGVSDETQDLIKKKITFVKRNVNRITKINNSKVYYSRVEGLNIYYYLKKNGIEYHYPIQYASIEFKNAVLN